MERLITIFILTSLILSQLSSIGQFNHSRITSIGENISVLKDESAAFGNPSLFVSNRKINAIVSYSSHYLIPELSMKSGALTFTDQIHHCALVIHQQGDSRYQTQQADAIYAQNFSPNFSIGIKLKIKRISFSNEYGSQNLFSGDIGMRLDVSTKSWLSVFIENPTRTKSYKPFNERMSSAFHLGYSHLFSDKLVSGVQISKSSDADFNLIPSLSYQFIKNVGVQIGYQSLLKQFSCGLTLPYKSFQSDLSILYHSELGTSLGLTITWSFTNDSKADSK